MHPVIDYHVTYGAGRMFKVAGKLVFQQHKDRDMLVFLQYGIAEVERPDGKLQDARNRARFYLDTMVPDGIGFKYLGHAAFSRYYDSKEQWLLACLQGLLVPITIGPDYKTCLDESFDIGAVLWNIVHEYVCKGNSTQTTVKANQLHLAI